MKNLFRWVTVLCVVSAIIAIGSIIFAVSTLDIEERHEALQDMRRGFRSSVYQIVEQPDGTLLVVNVLPTKAGVELPMSGITDGSTQNPNPNPDPDTNPNPNPNPMPFDKVERTPESVIAFFEGKGYPRAVAIGIVANLLCESSALDPNATNSSGYKGVCQWSSTRYSAYDSWLKSIGASNTIGAQCEFMYMEMNGISPAPPRYVGNLSVSNFKTNNKWHATKIFAKYFEGCIRGGGQMRWSSDNAEVDPTFASTCQGGSDARIKGTYSNYSGGQIRLYTASTLK